MTLSSSSCSSDGENDENDHENDEDFDEKQKIGLIKKWAKENNYL